MPTVKACLWNIQNYGSGTIATRWGDDSDLRNRFIRTFVRDQQIDLLLIMEPGIFSLPSLRDMALWLNGGLPDVDADWCLSLTGSALASGAHDPPRDQTEVTYMTDARVEGYAVAWRDRRATFDVLRGLNPIGTAPIHSSRNNQPPAGPPLNMTTRGRPTGNYDIVQPTGERKRGRQTVFGAMGGYVSSGVFPYDEDGVEMDHWPELRFPTTSTRNPSQLEMTRARRPAYVVLELANGGNTSRRLCPVAAYHAPSNAEKAEFGAMMAGLSRELYVTNDLDQGNPDPDELVHCRTTVMGGDFNYSVDQAQWPEWYAFFTGRFLRARAGGASTDPAPPPTYTDPNRRTTVQILEGDHTTPITSASLDDYLYHKIDLAFTRGDATAARVNLPQLLLDDDDGVYANTLKAFHTHLTGVVAGLAGRNQRQTTTGPQEYRWVQDRQKRWSQEWKPMICGSWGGTFRSWATFMRQMRNGRITDARRAAEFYHIFVSDHLPLVASIAW
ncbi:MAG TPA: hypothetical protein VF771_06730 [Longimicrobiaceae bacterium]